MARLVVLTFGLLALGVTSAVGAQVRHDDGCAADDRADAQGGHAAAHGGDACGDRPCPCDDDDDDCPPNCHDCACSTAGPSTVAPTGLLPAGPAPVARLTASPPLERRASGVPSRVFRPPRA